MRQIFVLISGLFIAVVLAPGVEGATAWDAKSNWSSSVNPGLIWSYREGNGNRMVRAVDCGGLSWDWSSPGGCPSLFNNTWNGSGVDEFQGHGPWIVRWTSPIDGYVTITGTLWQHFETSRRMVYHIIKNGTQEFIQGAVPHNGSQTLLGSANEVAFGPVEIQVAIGDRVDYLCDGSGQGGTGIATFVVASYHIEQSDGSQVVLPPAQIDGDVNRDGFVNPFDMIELAERWLRQDCVTPNYCLGADIDESGETDYVDYSYVNAHWLESIFDLKNLGYVVITPNGPFDGGDFGPGSSGTQTAGIQEAINFAHQNGKDVYYVGGGVKVATHPDIGPGIGPIVYSISGAITFPAAENFKFIGGECVFNYNLTSGTFVTIDSQKNSEIIFPLLVAPTIQSGSLLKIQPQSVRPDGQVGVSHSIIQVNAPVGSGTVFPDPNFLIEGHGFAVHLDAANGPIEDNIIQVREPIASEIGLFLEQGDIRNNQITTRFNHLCNNLVVVHSGMFNRIDALVNSDQLGGDRIGVNINGGEQNIYHITFTGGTDPGSALIFGPEARDNVVYATNVPLGDITNNATVPNNKIIPLTPLGFNVTTPTLPANFAGSVRNRTSFTVVATIETAGSVTSWVLTDSNGGSQNFSSGLYAGQTIILEPGDQIVMFYGSAPTWNWKVWR